MRFALRLQSFDKDKKITLTYAHWILRRKFAALGRAVDQVRMFEFASQRVKGCIDHKVNGHDDLCGWLCFPRLLIPLQCAVDSREQQQ